LPSFLSFAAARRVFSSGMTVLRQWIEMSPADYFDVDVDALSNTP
jgi:hypothetical protein